MDGLIDRSIDEKMDALIDALMDVLQYLQRVQIRESEYYYRRDGSRTALHF